MNCPNVLHNGTCSNPSCTLNHNILTCEPCNLIFPTPYDYNAHVATPKHKTRAEGAFAVSYCTICATNIPGGHPAWTQHVGGKKHKKAAVLNGVSPDVEPQAPDAQANHRTIFCEFCQTMIIKRHWEFHQRSTRHRSRQVFNRYKSAVEEAETDKNGVSVQGVFDFGFVEPADAQKDVRKSVSVTTSVPYCKCVLLEIKLASSQGRNTVIPAFSVVMESPSQSVTYGAPLRISIYLEGKHIGRYEDRIEFVFEDVQLRRTFIISRALKAIIGNEVEHEALKPKAPYVPRKRITRPEVKEIVEGVKPPALTAVRFAVYLPKANIPLRLKTILSGSGPPSRLIKDVRQTFLPQELNSATYAKHFKHLLWIEEFKMEQDLERYDIPDATMTRHNQYYFVDVPGLAEKRPSVLVGDRMFVQEENSKSGRWYEGHVHIVRQYEVGLCFHDTFHGYYVKGRRFEVRFRLNRLPSRKQHQAMDTVFMEDRVLFPTVHHLPRGRIPAASPLRLFNNLIASNERQLQAVTSILRAPPGSVPFIVFGPPGTGKTITIIEAMKQIIDTDPNARILACAPSNSAADLIALRLNTSLKPGDLFRFYAASRSKDLVPHQLMPYTHTSGGYFSVPPISSLKRYKVVVSTCVSASFPFAMGLSRGHFTHIFVDEAGQATEPEAFVSIKTLADSNTNVVLSGDPRQLGPIIRSSVARDLGLETSYLERLMSTDAYDIETGYGKSVVKLVQNFRSHPAILSFPNERFYDGELEPCASSAVMDRYLGSSILPNKWFPIVFHSVSGKDDREAHSPSFFNIDELLQVKDYVQRLRSDRQYRTTDNDIGIIAPYHAQCQKLRTSLRQVAEGVKVGSVEEFQGQERPVMIISTVRSSKEFVEYDLRHTLGFVANPRRFNVAVTRAQALLIVIGDPQVLSLDPLWRSFLNYVYLNGGWEGPVITWDPDVPVNESERYDKSVRNAARNDMNEFARRMEEITLKEAEEEEDPDANVDRPWRELE